MPLHPRGLLLWCIVPLVLLSSCGGATRALAPIRLKQIEIISFDDSSGSGGIPGSARVTPLTRRGERVVIPQVAGLRSLPLRWKPEAGVVGELGHWAKDKDTTGFEKPLFVRIGPGDSLWVFDGSRRVLVFDPAGVPGRQFTLPLDAWDALVLDDGRLVVSPANTGDSNLLALLTGEGVLLRALGGGEPALRLLLRGPDGEVWSLLATRQWRLEQWDTLLGRRAVVDRFPDWYQPYPTYRGPDAATPPLPSITGGWFDSTGRIWVMGRARDPDWRTGITPASGGIGDSSVVITDLDKVFDTVIEIVDPATGYGITQARFDTLYPLIAGAGVIGRGIPPVEGIRKLELLGVFLDISGDSTVRRPQR